MKLGSHKNIKAGPDFGFLNVFVIPKVFYFVKNVIFSITSFTRNKLVSDVKLTDRNNVVNQKQLNLYNLYIKFK